MSQGYKRSIQCEVQDEAEDMTKPRIELWKKPKAKIESWKEHKY